MFYVYIIVAVLVVIFVLTRLLTSPEERFAKGLARAQLVAILCIKDEYPQLSLKDRYREAIKTRPGYGDLEVDEVYKIVEQSNGSKDDPADVVEALIVYEYHKRVGLQQGKNDIRTIAHKTVLKMFPK